MLNKTRFCAFFKDRIKECISLTSFFTLVEGSLTIIFLATRGIRQGDPISSLLFVLVLEYLTYILREEEDVGDYDVYRMGE